MKKSIIIIAVILVASFTSNLFAQNTATATSPTAAKIVETIAIGPGVTGLDLNFGTMSKPSTIATVTVPNGGGARTFTGTITLLNQNPAHKAASYATTGDPSAYYTITLPGTIQVTYTNGSVSESMDVDNFKCSKPDLGNVQFDGTGHDNFTVGATLNLAANQAAGSYTGSYPVTVAYN
ncbi:MAG: DUF4402 domain-containing protein [Bacteroidetes bacterium]|nr:DUF4402 domain-containing protein [Bacteroidota bacterium]